MSEKTSIIKIGDWVVRQRIPEVPGPHRLILLLHGWTGDENSMWIFTPRLPRNYLILSPRGITRTLLGGFGWENTGVTGWPSAQDFQDAIGSLFELVASFKYPELRSDQFDVVGFSQGAAFAYTMILQYPERINQLAGLSGFLPKGLDKEIIGNRLKNKKIFVSHGSADEIVPVDQARIVVRELKSAGSEVIYCEEDVGHKLSAGCFRAMDDYFSG
ncbi:MAG TPA: dienelactone hydrolase family protein [Anaerolineales bacterium]|jgi:phospholipase/carboxylesterase|nr:dienelactone hydrolase family protein [Anaerolineales bacterium]